MAKFLSVENIILPNKPLSNFELIDAVKELKIKYFRGVYLRDQLPKRPWKKECGIVNLADSNDLRGTHWVCYYENKYFDSYGIQPPLEIIDYLGEEVQYNKFQIQDFETVVCGHLCLYVLSRLSKGDDFHNIIISLL